MKIAVWFVLMLFQQGANATPALGTLKMCIDHYPPLHILQDKGKVLGENIEVARLLTSQLNFNLSFTDDIPFGRCMQWLREGKVDIMAGVLDTAERRKFAHLFLYKDVTIKQFFTLKNGPNIKTFTDLKGLRVGVIRGVKHFRKFDNAKEDDFSKVELLSLEAAFGMLVKGRLDAVLCTDRHGLRIINKKPELKQQIVSSEYSEDRDTQVYIALSKRSPFAQYVNAFDKVAVELYSNKKFARAISEFKRKNPQFYSTLNSSN